MDTYDRLVRILADEHKLAAETLQPEARLDELGIDSLSVMELLFKIEEEFGIQVPNDQVQLVTVDDMVRYVSDLVARQADGVPHQAAS
jgi:acyl carrier protein